MKSTKFDRKCRLRWIILMLQGLSEAEALARSTLFTNEGSRANFTVAELAARGVFPHTGTLAKLIHQGELRGDDPDKVLGTDPANVAIPSWETICPAPFVCGDTHLPGLVPELRHNLPSRMWDWNHFDVMQFVLYGEEPKPRVPNILAAIASWNPSESELAAAIQQLIQKSVALGFRPMEQAPVVVPPWLTALQKKLTQFHAALPGLFCPHNNVQADLADYAAMQTRDGKPIFPSSLAIALPKIWNGTLSEQDAIDNALALSAFLGGISATQLLQEIGLDPAKLQATLLSHDS